MNDRDFERFKNACGKIEELSCDLEDEKEEKRRLRASLVKGEGGLNEYQKQAKEVSKVPMPNDTTSLMIFGLGVAEEAGEVAGWIKKMVRDEEYDFHTPEKRENLLHELGDVLWYVSRIAGIADMTLEDVAQANIMKLLSITEEKRKRDG